MTSDQLITVMAWGLVAMGGALVGSLLWFARRTVSQGDRMARILTRIILRVSILESKAGIRTMEQDMDAEG